jgi:Tfp pilus assembly protein FimT
MRSRGITILELLIVLVIMLMVTAAAIPMMAPALRNRQMREATRLVSAYLGAARARAVQTGRPVGVVIEREDGSAFSLRISQVEVPPPYAGDVQSASAVVTPSATPSTSAQSMYTSTYQPTGLSVKWYSATVNGLEFNPSLVRVGDQIQFNAQGSRFLVLGPDADSNGVIDSPPAPPAPQVIPLDVAYLYRGTLTRAFPWDNTTPAPQPPSFFVFRQPVRSTAQPLLLPEGIVVDLSLSGVGSDLFNSTNYGAYTPGSTPIAPIVNCDPMIVFSPSGRLEWVTNKVGQLVRPLASVNLLMGRRELMFDVTAKGDPADLVFQNLSPAPPASATNTLMPPAENFWMTIGHQTGTVSVSQVAPHLQDYKGQTGGITFTTQQDIINLALNGSVTPPYSGALSFAKESQSLGGR